MKTGQGARAELLEAWRMRERSGFLEELGALRVFHGPGEGTEALARVAIDRFGRDYWVTGWAGGGAKDVSAPLPEIVRFLQERGARSAVALLRPERGLPEKPEVLFGEPPEDRFEVTENDSRFWIRLRGTRHPGLFLDHFPLRRWLRGRSRGLSVLNAFSYTGSLSVACGLGGAAHVTTLDLSGATIQWAGENWTLNGLSDERARFIAGDYFDWLPRLKREGKLFDCIILDPPSFSRGKKGSFSTSKDLRKLHCLAISVLAPGGMLATSINSANVSREKFEAEVAVAVREAGREMPRVLWTIDLPETFPTRLGVPEDRYLKGWVLKF